MIFPEVIKRIASELKTADFDTVWCSSTTWNALKASSDTVEQIGDEYAVTLITCGRKIHVFCDPTLEDGDVTTNQEEEDEQV